MCAEKIQRLLMGVVITISMVLFIQGMTQIAAVVQTSVIVMIAVWAFTDFCPSLWLFKKLFGSCYSVNCQN